MWRAILLGIACTVGNVVVRAWEIPPQRVVVITSPKPIDRVARRPRIFLAGSIEMGKAEDWQKAFIDQIADLEVEVLNPRRADWNADWKPEYADAHFREQVEWELEALESSDLIVMYLAPGTHSPVSLLELGLYARSGRLLLHCPQGFWRKGNVDAVAARYAIPTVASLPELATAARQRLKTIAQSRRSGS